MKVLFEVSTSSKSRKFDKLISALACFDLLADYSGYVVDMMDVMDTLEEKDIFVTDNCKIRVVYVPEVINEK